ncbi:MAG: tetratricopeptide repeat protein [Planctomycetes bacterium]|nr:tetratricopeptide repeat protein [Planctomycetota bacterium]
MRFGSFTFPLPRRVPGHLWCAAAIIVAGVGVYLSSFAGVFLYDDLREIVENRGIRSFTSIWSNRPLVTLSLALNYHFGQLNPWGYHLFNLLIHLLGGLTLYGIVRRVLAGQFRSSRAGSAHWYALVIALIWVVHPLQTESVTYIIQRAESMMGLLYLLTIYCVLRSSSSPRPWAWHAAAVAACGLGMCSKPVMITAPVVALLFDWTLITRSIAETLRQRWTLYVGLCGTWLFLIATGTTDLIFQTDPSRRLTAGFGYDGSTPLQYALTQPGVIVHYLKLAIWPRALCLDYDWPLARTAGAVVWPGVLILLMLLATLWSFRARPWLAFLGSSFFLILSPTSSVVPFAHPAFEHRMYLPLAAVITLLILAGGHFLERLHDRFSLPTATTARTGGILALTVVTLFGLATIDRNRDYHSAFDMWADVMIKRPDNPLPYNEIGNMLIDAGKFDMAVGQYQRAVALNPGAYLARTNLANAHLRLGRFDEAVQQCREALRIDPYYHPAHNVLGGALVERGDLDEGIAHLREAVRLQPNDPQSHCNLGRALAIKSGLVESTTKPKQKPNRKPKPAGSVASAAEAQPASQLVNEAIKHLVEAIRLQPDFAPAISYLAVVLSLQGSIDETINRYRDRASGVRLDRVQALAYVICAERFRREGLLEEAIRRYRKARAIDPSLPVVADRLEAASETGAAWTKTVSGGS